MHSEPTSSHGTEINQAIAAMLDVAGDPENMQIVPLGAEASGHQDSAWLEQLDAEHWQVCSIPERAQSPTEERRGVILSPTSGALDSWYWAKTARRDKFPSPVTVARDSHPDFVQPEDSNWSAEQYNEIFAQAIEVLAIETPYVALDADEVPPEGFEGYVVRKMADSVCHFTVSHLYNSREELLLRIENPGASDKFGRGKAFDFLLSHLLDRPSFSRQTDVEGR